MIEQKSYKEREATDRARHLTACAVCRNGLEPDDTQKLYAVKNGRTRQFVHVLVNGKSLAETVGWPPEEILYSLMEKNGTIKRPTMTDEAKERLRIAAQDRKLKKSLRTNTPARPEDGEQKEEPMASKKTKKAKVKSGGGRGSIFVFDLPATAVVRWMGKDGFSLAETKAALKEVGVSKMPTDACIRTFLYAGKKGQRGEPAKLTAEQQKALRDTAKVLEAKVKAEEKETADA